MRPAGRRNSGAFVGWSLQIAGHYYGIPEKLFQCFALLRPKRTWQLSSFPTIVILVLVHPGSEDDQKDLNYVPRVGVIQARLWDGVP